MLDKLVKVELRDIWKTEAQDFTPWLAQDSNLETLGEALNMELELKAREKSVGPFSADILCTNTDDGSLVLIENQLEKTDHTHLGQLMTYAAGLHTVNIVWIARKFTDEHRAAMDWLNDITNVEFRFFGLEVELWKIGESLAAPKFNVVCKPNDWSRSVSRNSGVSLDNQLTQTQSKQLEFWSGLQSYLEEAENHIRPQTPRPQHWMNFGIGKTGMKLVALLNTRNNTVGVGFETFEDGGKQIFDQLYSKKEEIEADLGFAPQWDRLDGKKATHVWYFREGNLDQVESWPEYFEWLTQHLESMDRAFRNRLKAL